MALSGPELVRAWFKEVWDEGRVDAIDRYLAPDWTTEGLELPGSPELSLQERFKLLHRDFRAAFPDIRITVDRTVSENDLVAAHCTVRGTHKGEALGFPATDRQVEFTGLAMLRIKDGKFVQSWQSWNFLDMHKQLGRAPA